MQQMDTERPHHNKGSSSCTSDLFMCFTSCVTSSTSSMKLPSLSPGRTKDSLTSSLSRRLKTSGSLKGTQASPMFPLFTKKRGSAFDNPEPSSPKVTCIGQVRVKTKKQGKRLRLMRASKKRRRNNHHHQGELNVNNTTTTSTTIRSHSLRSQTQKQECLPHRNQRWVHLPMTICDAVRALGSSCVSSPVRSRESSSSCGVMPMSSSCCARWFVCMHEGDDGHGKEREIEFVVGHQEDDQQRPQGHRRHVFEDIHIDESKLVHVEENQCVPPRNALLLMRCRSDPVKMSALVNRFCESPLSPFEEDFEESKGAAECVKDNDEVVYEKCVFSEANDQEHEIQVVHANEQEMEEEDKEVSEPEPAEDTTLSSSCTEVVVLQDENDNEREQVEDEQDYEETGPSLCSSFLASLLHSESEEEETKDKENDDNIAEQSTENTQEKKVSTHERSQSEPSGQMQDHQEIGDRETTMLPECLLLMMYEPKLSMEVSKETWVCSTDFIRILPRKQVKKSDTSKDEPKKIVSSIDTCKQHQQQPQLQPRRSSCHYPSAAAAAAAGIGCGGGSMAAMVEQKLAKSHKGTEPLGLTRCKSEPMRSSSAKFAAVQDACVWNNGKIGSAGFEPKLS